MVDRGGERQYILGRFLEGRLNRDCYLTWVELYQNCAGLVFSITINHDHFKGGQQYGCVSGGVRAKASL